MKKKTENYSKEQVEALKVVYNEAQSDDARKEAVESLAQDFGRSPASIRSKLVHLGVYKKPERKAKDGSDIERKDDIVEDIAEACGMDSELFDSLEKANKSVLKAIRETLRDSQNFVPEAS